MADKPTCEELEQRIKELEKETIKLNRSDELLRESEERFRLLYERAPLGYQSLDENGHFLEVNQAWLDTLGYTREEVIGKSFGDFLHPEWVDHFKENFPRFKAVGEILGVEFEMVKKDGSFLMVAFTGKIGRDGKGAFKQTHCILEDITSRKKIEEALRESEKRFRSIVENTEAGYFFIDRDGCFQNVNEAWLRMHKYSSADEVVGKHFSISQIDTDQREAQKVVEKLLGGEPVPTGEFRRRCKDGSIGYHTFTVNPVIRGDKIIGLEGFIIDISEQKKLEAHLLQAQKMEAVATLAGGVAHQFNNALSAVTVNLDMLDMDSMGNEKINISPK